MSMRSRRRRASRPPAVRTSSAGAAWGRRSTPSPTTRPKVCADSPDMAGMPAGRGIGAGYNKFVSESFVDEIAAARGVDPLAMRLELTKNHPRAGAVIKAVAEMADWKRKRPGRALGLAFADYHDPLTAGI